MVSTILLVLLTLDLIVVPGRIWWEAIRLLDTGRAPAGITASQIGGLAGFTALASGLNWYVMGHYRDKGYGMGHRAGYLAGLRGEQKELLASGVTFPDDQKNRDRWRRWYRLLLIDMWGCFSSARCWDAPPHHPHGARSRSRVRHRPERRSNLRRRRPRRPVWRLRVLPHLIIGVLILYSTQLGIFEAMVRVTTDASHATSSTLRARIEQDPRRFYYPFMLLLLIVISAFVYNGPPVGLVIWSANMANLGALIYPFLLIYLNSRLPKPARPRPYHYVILLLNSLFFGFFFINFVAGLFGVPLVTF